jgi:hypothetical protein
MKTQTVLLMPQRVDRMLQVSRDSCVCGYFEEIALNDWLHFRFPIDIVNEPKKDFMLLSYMTTIHIE